MANQISQIQLRLSPELKTHLLKVSAQNDISVSEYLRRLISKDKEDA